MVFYLQKFQVDLSDLILYLPDDLIFHLGILAQAKWMIKYYYRTTLKGFIWRSQEQVSDKHTIYVLEIQQET